MPITPGNPFKGRHYSGEVILLAVRWYLRYPLAYEHVAEMLAERGLVVDVSGVWRWVQAYAPELNKRCRPHLLPTNKSYRIDETYIRIKGQDRFVSVCLFAGAQCADPGMPHAITRNFSSDLYGPVDTRPGTWGHADYWVLKQPFTNVPAGCRVEVLRISGDLMAWAKGAVPAGTYAGVLMGAYSSAGAGSTRAGLCG